MANRLRKLMAPMLKEECAKAFRRGYEEGKEVGWQKRVLAYENEIECLKKQLKMALLIIEDLAEENADLKK